MNPDLSSFIGRPYKFDHSPRIDLDAEAVNCQKLVHQLYQARLGICLPLGMWSKEIHEDETLIFQTVTDHFRFEGDIGIFGPRQSGDPRYFHLAYFTGKTEQGEPRLIHATAYEQRVSLWRLSDFFAKPRYEELKRIKRLQPHLFDTQVRQSIINL